MFTNDRIFKNRKLKIDIIYIELIKETFKMASNNSIFNNLLSTKGRMRRRHFGIIFIILLVIRLLLFIVSDNSSSHDKQFLVVFIQLILIVILLLQIIKRCHDFGKSGWFSLIVIIPIVGILYLLFAPGNIGSNEYGDDPKNIHYNLDENK